MSVMDAWSVPDIVANAVTLAKDIGKGGGGSTEEPTVCFSLLPFGLALAWLGLRRLRQLVGPRRL